MLSRLMSNLKWHWETKRTRILYGWRLAYLGHGATIDRGVRIQCGRNVRIGDNTRVAHGTSILTVGSGDHVHVGNNCRLAGSVCLDSAGGHVEIGDNVYLGPYSTIAGHGGCKIGNDCQIAAFCYIIASDHKFDDPDVPIRLQGHETKGIIVEEDCWLGNGVTILDGTTVGRGSVLAARCVVTKNVLPNSVMAGVPAKLLRSRC